LTGSDADSILPHEFGHVSTTVQGVRLLAAERHRRIVAAIHADGAISTDELARRLGVSQETVRRDLTLLEQRRALRRVHGGAAPTAAGDERLTLDGHRGTDAGSETPIVARATQLVEPGQTLVLDIGPMAVAVARGLPPSFHGTVATCSLLVAAELAHRADIEVLVCGGRVRGGDLAVSNATAVAFFADLRADLAFLASGGIDARAGLTDHHLDEVATRRTIIEHSARSYVLAPASALGRVAPHRVCGLSEVSGVITDAPVPAELAAALDGAHLVLSGEP
jgi:DeoR/GlpR family transcriptional regulator of sugar metabolism